ILQDVQAGICIGQVHNSIRIDKYVAGLNDFGRIWPLVDNFFRRRRHEIADLSGLKWVAYVEDPQSRIVVGSENHILSLQRARPVLMEIMRSEFCAFGTEVLLSRRRQGGDRNRV